MKIVKIAIDGPAAAGKSTVAQLVAKELNFVYIDTGAMYRAVTVFCLEHNISCQDERKVADALKDIEITLYPDHSISLNGKDVTKEIRQPIVNAHVSYIAQNKDVRLFLVKQQRKIAENVSVVMDGRDIGTYVLPDADVKIFQIASVETRAKRRYLENIQKGIPCSLESIQEELKKRDYIDSNRDFAPLKQAEDAIPLDTSNMSIEEAVKEILNIVYKKVGYIHG